MDGVREGERRELGNRLTGCVRVTGQACRVACVGSCTYPPWPHLTTSPPTAEW